MFINCSNHKSSDWSKEQLDAARMYGDIVEIPFPAVKADSTMEEIESTAEEICSRIVTLSPTCVMCQGEFTLTYALVKRLLIAGINTVAACAERSVEEKKLEDGSTQKTAVFRFVGFRNYK